MVHIHLQLHGTLLTWSPRPLRVLRLSFHETEERPKVTNATYRESSTIISNMTRIHCISNVLSLCVLYHIRH